MDWTDINKEGIAKDVIRYIQQLYVNEMLSGSITPMSIQLASQDTFNSFIGSIIFNYSGALNIIGDASNSPSSNATVVVSATSAAAGFSFGTGGIAIFDIASGNPNIFWTQDSSFNPAFVIDDTGNITVGSLPATSTTTLQNSHYMRLLAQYWTGSATAFYSIKLTANMLGSSPNGVLVINMNGSDRFKLYDSAVGFGVSNILGLDNRKGITTADASAITLYTVGADSNPATLFRVSARAFSTAGTSATYVITWTEGGVVNTQTLTVSAVDTEESAVLTIQPDSATAITAQITAVTSTTLNVATIVEAIA